MLGSGGPVLLCVLLLVCPFRSHAFSKGLMHFLTLSTFCVHTNPQVANHSDMPVSFALKSLPTARMEEDLAAARLEQVRK